MTTMRRPACLLAALGLAAALAACGKGPATSSSSASLKEKDKQYVRETLAAMRDDVRVALFSRDGGECRFCGDAEALLADIAAAAPRVKLEVLSLKKDAARARELGIDRVPGIAILGSRDFGLRYFGLPSGYDFPPFVETLRSAANADPELEPATVAGLKRLAKPVQLTVFVTQT